MSWLNFLNAYRIVKQLRNRQACTNARYASNKQLIYLSIYLSKSARGRSGPSHVCTGAHTKKKTDCSSRFCIMMHLKLHSL